MLYHTSLNRPASLNNMKINLTNKQFKWLSEGLEYNATNLEILRKHYVEGSELKDLAKEAGFSSPARIYTLVKSFEANVKKRLTEHDVKMSVVMHPAKEKRFTKFDVSE